MDNHSNIFFKSIRIKLGKQKKLARNGIKNYNGLKNLKSNGDTSKNLENTTIVLPFFNSFLFFVSTAA